MQDEVLTAFEAIPGMAELPARPDRLELPDDVAGLFVERGRRVWRGVQGARRMGGKGRPTVVAAGNADGQPQWLTRRQGFITGDFDFVTRDFDFITRDFEDFDRRYRRRCVRWNLDPRSTEFTIIHVLPAEPDPDPLPAFQARPEAWYEKFVPVSHGVLFAVYFFMAILLGIVWGAWLSSRSTS